MGAAAVSLEIPELNKHFEAIADYSSTLWTPELLKLTEDAMNQASRPWIGDLSRLTDGLVPREIIPEMENLSGLMVKQNAAALAVGPVRQLLEAASQPLDGLDLSVFEKIGAIGLAAEPLRQISESMS